MSNSFEYLVTVVGDRRWCCVVTMPDDYSIDTEAWTAQQWSTFTQHAEQRAAELAKKPGRPALNWVLHGETVRYVTDDRSYLPDMADQLIHYEHSGYDEQYRVPNNYRPRLLDVFIHEMSKGKRKSTKVVTVTPDSIGSLQSLVESIPSLTYGGCFPYIEH